MLSTLSNQLRTAPRTQRGGVGEEHLIAVLLVFSPARARVDRSRSRTLQLWRRRPAVLIDTAYRLAIRLVGAGRYPHIVPMVDGLAVEVNRLGVKVYPEGHLMHAHSRRVALFATVDLDQPLRLAAIELLRRRRVRPSFCGSVANRLTFGLWPMPPHCLGLSVAILRAGGVSVPRRITSVAALLTHLEKHHAARSTVHVPAAQPRPAEAGSAQAPQAHPAK